MHIDLRHAVDAQRRGEQRFSLTVVVGCGVGLQLRSRCVLPLIVAEIANKKGCRLLRSEADNSLLFPLLLIWIDKGVKAFQARVPDRLRHCLSLRTALRLSLMLLPWPLIRQSCPAQCRHCAMHGWPSLVPDSVRQPCLSTAGCSFSDWPVPFHSRAVTRATSSSSHCLRQ